MFICQSVFVKHCIYVINYKTGTFTFLIYREAATSDVLLSLFDE